MIGDFWDVVTLKPVRDVAGDAIDAFASLPGISTLVEASGDFARTAVGQVVLSAITDSMFGSIAFVVGPQLASLSWAIPGLMRGDSFEDAWLKSFTLRVEQTATILGGDAAAWVAGQLPIALETLGANFPPGEFSSWAEAELAKRAGNIREDISRQALDLWNREALFNPDDFDPATGRRISVGASGRAVSAFGTMALKKSVVGTWAGDNDTTSRMTTRVVGTFAGDNALPPSLQPATRYSATAPPSPRNGMGANLALGGVVLAAAGALYLWYRS